MRTAARLWVRGIGDAVRQATGRGTLAPKGHSGGLLSPLLETRRTGEAARWIEGDRVLDCGCGRGRLIDFLPAGASYTGVDHDPELIGHLRRRFPGERREFVESALPPEGLGPSRPFDSIVLTAVVEHLEDPGSVVRALTRSLRPGGVLIVTTPAPRYNALLRVGGRLGLFDREAEEDHEALLGKPELARMAREAGLVPERYYRFLMGGNQLQVARKPGVSSGSLSGNRVRGHDSE